MITRDHLAPFIGDATDFLPQDVSDRWKAPLAEQHPHVTGVQKGKRDIAEQQCRSRVEPAMGKWIKRPRCQGRTAQGPDEPIEAARCYIKLCAINSCLLLNVNITMPRGTALCCNMFCSVVLFSTMQCCTYQISIAVLTQ